MLTPEAQARIAEYRAKATAGTITLEEMKAAVIFMRGTRKSALSEPSEPGSKRSKRPTRSADEMLNELEGL